MCSHGQYTGPRLPKRTEEIFFLYENLSGLGNSQCVKPILVYLFWTNSFVLSECYGTGWFIISGLSTLIPSRLQSAASLKGSRFQILLFIFISSFFQWDVPIPLQSAIMSLPKGVIQDFTYILLAKSRELSNRRVSYAWFVTFYCRHLAR